MNSGSSCPVINEMFYFTVCREEVPHNPVTCSRATSGGNDSLGFHPRKIPSFQDVLQQVLLPLCSEIFLPDHWNFFVFFFFFSLFYLPPISLPSDNHHTAVYEFCFVCSLVLLNTFTFFTQPCNSADSCQSAL